MKIWVDADACPSVIKDILFKAADRNAIVVTLVANRQIRIPKSPYITFIRVSSGFDVADNEIVKKLHKDDLVITSDIPLAADVVAKGASALNPRGEMYSEDNIKARSSMRDFMDTLRASGIDTGGPSTLSKRNRQDFANQLDKIIRQHSRRS